jgi:transposase
MTDAVRTIDREELKQKLERHEGVKLVMSLSDWDFKRKRIPGSLHFDTDAAMLAALGKNDEIVVYCSNPPCRRSIASYHLLKDHGFTNVRRYAGGVADWEDAGLPLEGSCGVPPFSWTSPLARVCAWRDPMAKRKRRQFTAEFKADAVKLCEAGGRSVGQVAADLDLTETALREWVKRAATDEGKSAPNVLTTAERDELSELRKRVKRLEMEREILKKAAPYSTGQGNIS